MNAEQILGLLYGALALDAVLIAIPGFINWNKLRFSPDFKYFAWRALLTASAHIMEALALVALLTFKNAAAVWTVLIVWQLGELFKVAGEWGITGSLYGKLNGVHLPQVVHTISPAMNAAAPTVQVVAQKVEIVNKEPVEVRLADEPEPPMDGGSSG